MKSLRLKKDLKKKENNVIKDIRNLFRLQKELDETAIKDIGNFFRLNI